MTYDVDSDQCSARSKTSGKRCRQLAIPGGTVCTYHGGAAEQVQDAAHDRLEIAAKRAAHPWLDDFEIIAELIRDHHFDYTEAKAAYDANPTEENRVRKNEERAALGRFILKARKQHSVLDLPREKRGAVIEVWLLDEEDLIAEKKASMAALPPSRWQVAEPQGILIGELPASPRVVEGEVTP